MVRTMGRSRKHKTKTTEFSHEPLSAQQLEDFRTKVWQQGAQLYRDLPWRHIDDPYGVLVSEVMLQQTQVARVMNYWQRWMELFPSVDALSAADMPLVLEQWQGLGYNRRALALKRACEQCSVQFGGKLPSTEEELLALPGIGPATCAGVRAFAHNLPAVYLETNVRTVFLHEFFPDEEQVSDVRLRPLVEQTCSTEDPRTWYYALLDWGAHLKQTIPNPSRRSAHYTKQSSFEGSRRQKRAEILRFVLARGQADFEQVHMHLAQVEEAAGRERPERELVDALVTELATEGFFKRESNRITA